MREETRAHRQNGWKSSLVGNLVGRNYSSPIHYICCFFFIYRRCRKINRNNWRTWKKTLGTIRKKLRNLRYNTKTIYRRSRRRKYIEPVRHVNAGKIRASMSRLVLVILWLVEKVARFFFQLSVESNFLIALFLYCYALWLAKKSRAIFSTNQKWNHNQSWLARTRFPALGAGSMCLLWVLIGSRDRLRLLFVYILCLSFCVFLVHLSLDRQWF